MKALMRTSTAATAPGSPPAASWIRSLVVSHSSLSSPSSASPFSPSPLSRRIRVYEALSPHGLGEKGKKALSRRRWYSLFTLDGRFRDGGVKFLKKVRSRGIDPSIRAEVWPFLLGVYDLNSTEADRNAIRTKKRKEYQKLRRRCKHLLHQISGNTLLSIDEVNMEEGPTTSDPGSPFSQDLSRRHSFANEHPYPRRSEIIIVDPNLTDSESSDSDSSYETGPENLDASPEPGPDNHTFKFRRSLSVKRDDPALESTCSENFATWQRIIRLDAVRVHQEWVLYSPSQAAVSAELAAQRAESVGLKDYEHLEPCMMYHAARLVAILEAYAVYDPEIGYCQGMSDLLSPIAAVMEEDYQAFWCFAGFMKKARHNFRLDELGIKRQLNIVSRIIKRKDSQLYRHLEKLKAEDCFFVYRMVLVLFRRELTFDQTLCLWEVMWADQAAIRAGIGQSVWGRIRMQAPPTDDLLLYAIAACILQKRKQIVHNHSSMDEIMRECNSMAGQLDVWRLLDDAHNLVMNLHDKI
ncbi:Ypt/Rab-GAP domain of gyp1p superfamily protein [Rhynchospora pubera]|uniref:Ypt/Rab-GAP domain of gyp1p superfamily protein n=1 Tax=Rhynchospora pubera TaxID=906938 RepID=A0AAV8GS03_9POAL|nr:Ypt/Rab-GAP domain of gyp1p superfamily protein [Rhynchospora pubera]